MEEEPIKNCDLRDIDRIFQNMVGDLYITRIHVRSMMFSACPLICSSVFFFLNESTDFAVNNQLLIRKDVKGRGHAIPKK